MASVTASSVKFSSVSCFIKQNQVSNLKKTSLSFSGKAFQSRRLPVLRFRVACSAKDDTVKKVCEIVRKQLALPDDRDVNGESKFSQLGADSLDTVEIVMGLEEEFGICVEEESAQSISTVQEAADLIEMLLEKKC
ncbi:acyl carrier protein 5 [Perilla frutescens var. hirtella]|uniref:Acyl carrier protein n=1 Tax=Perilla frutescens var. hirtella TaxID=608512 RepID=A0AAD4INK0_PERFH|nr:acyl carrier protein 5 [Perilla frutescens var. hirtella]KAH6769792.1 acyl carrier protein 5 [Perilla frutescens var. hirtella]KAH6816564.1 acyl carrier protein 5 [Perilla frutescens var. frutescens]